VYGTLKTTWSKYVWNVKNKMVKFKCVWNAKNNMVKVCVEC